MLHRHSSALVPLWSTCFVLLLVACGGGAVDEAVTQSHPWYRPPVEVPPRAVELPEWLVRPVRSEEVERITGELQAEPVIQVSPGEADFLASGSVEVPMEMRPFVVRALARPGDQITVLTWANSVWVRASGGDTSVPAQPQPVVLMQDPTPLEVYITVD